MGHAIRYYIESRVIIDFSKVTKEEIQHGLVSHACPSCGCREIRTHTRYQKKYMGSEPSTSVTNATSILARLFRHRFYSLQLGGLSNFK